MEQQYKIENNNLKKFTTTVIVPLANAYIEILCYDMEKPEMKRHWVIVRTVDYKYVCWC